MKRILSCLIFLAVTAVFVGNAAALQERTITDEPSVNKPKAPAAQPAPVQPAKPDAAQPSQPPVKDTPPSQWTPPGADAPADRTQDDASTGSTSGSTAEMFRSPEAREVKTYSRKEIDQQVMGFFEGGARGLAELITKAFEKYGEPVGFIKGSEGAGALVVGLRYGEGWLHLKNGQKAYVYWQSPSIGFDLGVNASKVFCLIYGMSDINQIYQRYPSVDGSAYVVGGFGMNYQRSGSVTLAPIRFGVGLRLGANLGYMHFTKERTINPF